MSRRVLAADLQALAEVLAAAGLPPLAAVAVACDLARQGYLDRKEDAARVEDARLQA